VTTREIIHYDLVVVTLCNPQGHGQATLDLRQRINVDLPG